MLLVPRPVQSHLPVVPTTEDAVGDYCKWNDIRQARVIRAWSHDRSIGDEISFNRVDCTPSQIQRPT
jgi:hypothetical protein